MFESLKKYIPVLMTLTIRLVRNVYLRISARNTLVSHWNNGSSIEIISINEAPGKYQIAKKNQQKYN